VLFIISALPYLIACSSNIFLRPRTAFCLDGDIVGGYAAFGEHFFLQSIFLFFSFYFLCEQLAEALLSLANLTADEDAREALYARAKAEGGEAVARDLGPSPTRIPNADVLMDES
jgi:hypothetical protein